MPRPQKKRIVNKPPLYSSFKPAGVMKKGLQQISFSLDEYEAVRLADYLKLEHEEAAVEMEISRSTFTRLLERARGKVAAFLIEGKELCVEGGSIHFRDNIMRCLGCGHIFSTRIDETISSCPSCGSENLLDVAGGYGHGRCCRQFRYTKDGE
jgi:predicted DNA-binding protein (UPF0251 family)